jgi:UDP-glucose 4-epimerase
MKILITGGFGFLGGRMARFLSKASGNEIVLGARNIHKQPASLAGFRVVETGWESPEKLKEACKGVDSIIHLAGMDAASCAADPVKALEFNGVTTAKLINIAIDAGVKQFVFFSTAHVYSAPLIGRVTENSLPASLHPYATSNRAGEDVVLAQSANEKINGIVIRLSNSYGSPAHDEANCWTLLVNDLCKQAVVSRKLVVKSNGLQRRNFVTITDACNATSHLMQTTLLAKLIASGFEPSDNRNEEIDGLLKYCKATFG